MRRGDVPSVAVRAALVLAWAGVTYVGADATVQMLDAAGDAGTVAWGEWLQIVGAAYGGLLVVGWATMRWTRRP